MVESGEEHYSGATGAASTGRFLMILITTFLSSDRSHPALNWRGQYSKKLLLSTGLVEPGRWLAEQWGGGLGLCWLLPRTLGQAPGSSRPLVCADQCRDLSQLTCPQAFWATSALLKQHSPRECKNTIFLFWKVTERQRETIAIILLNSGLMT